MIILRYNKENKRRNAHECEGTAVCLRIGPLSESDKGGQNLFISQPALSIYISNLENSLGVKLFERIGKSFILTYAGERYVETAKKMLDLNEGFEQELQEIVGEYKGCVRLGMQTGVPPIFCRR